MKHADALAQVVDLDMVAAGWTPTVESYLGRVTKPRILEAVRDGKGDREAQLIEHLKKGDMAKERSEEHTSELQSLMRSSYAVFCLKKKTNYICKTLIIYMFVSIILIIDPS